MDVGGLGEKRNRLLAKLLMLGGTHTYLSTGCLHGDRIGHHHCQSDSRLDGLSKIPAKCKWCDSVCICWCHEEDDHGTES